MRADNLDTENETLADPVTEAPETDDANGDGTGSDDTTDGSED